MLALPLIAAGVGLIDAYNTDQEKKSAKDAVLNPYLNVAFYSIINMLGLGYCYERPDTSKPYQLKPLFQPYAGMKLTALPQDFFKLLPGYPADTPPQGAATGGGKGHGTGGITAGFFTPVLNTWAGLDSNTKTAIVIALIMLLIILFL